MMFEEAGVPLGFIILGSFGLLLLVAAFYFGAYTFVFLQGAIAGALTVPVACLPATYCITAICNED